MPLRASTCPNPECQKRIEKPILLNILSTTPAEQYYACPYCFIKLNVYGTRANLAGIFLTAFGSIILAYVAWLVWYDISMWGKDVTLILLESRTREAYSLGIGMRIVHYLLIGLALLTLGLCTFLLGRRRAIRLRFNVTAREENARAVEVTLRLPRKLVDFLKTQEENMGTTLEEYLQGSVFNRVAADLDASKSDTPPDVHAQLIEEIRSQRNPEEQVSHVGR